MKTFTYTEQPYKPQKDLTDQITDYCSKHPNTRFHSMGQKISQTKDLQGNPRTYLVLIYETCNEAKVITTNQA